MPPPVPTEPADRARPSGLPRLFVKTAKAVYKATPSASVRQLCFSWFCRMVRGRRTIATIDGSRYELELGEMIDLALYLEQYERDVAAALRTYCRPGMTVLDVGANIGAHTLPLARLVTAAGAVYAFEPMEFAFRKLARNVSLNDVPQVRIVHAALGDEQATGRVLDYRSSWQTGGGRSDRPATADVLRLDDWCTANGVEHADLIKIDVDGNEFAVFSGGRELLRRSRPVIVMEAVWPHFATNTRNPFLLLQGLGYRFFDAVSAAEFSSLDALAGRFPPEDRGMTMSLNVIARPMPGPVHG